MSGTPQAVAAPERKRCTGGRMERKKHPMAERGVSFDRLFLEVAETCGASWENTRKSMVALCWEQGAPAPCRPWREMGEGKFSPAVPRNRPNYEGREAFVPRLRRLDVPGVRSSPEFNGGRVTGSKGFPPLANSGGRRKEEKSSFAVLGDSPNYEGREAFIPRLRWLDVPGGRYSPIFPSLLLMPEIFPASVFFTAGSYRSNPV